MATLKLFGSATWLCCCLVTSIAALESRCAAAEQVLAIALEQIEADWVRQNQLRDAPAALAGVAIIAYNTTQIIERGRSLAENLRQLGADIRAEVTTLEDVAAQLKNLPIDATDSQRHDLDRRAHWAQRKMSLSNPLLDFDSILFIKRVPGLFPHVSDQYCGWWSRGGGGIHILSCFRGDNPQVHCLTDDWPTGSFLRPDLSYDGKTVLFACCKHYPHVADVPGKTDKDSYPYP